MCCHPLNDHRRGEPDTCCHVHAEDLPSNGGGVAPRVFLDNLDGMPVTKPDGWTVQRQNRIDELTAQAAQMEESHGSTEPSHGH